MHLHCSLENLLGFWALLLLRCGIDHPIELIIDLTIAQHKGVISPDRTVIRRDRCLEQQRIFRFRELVQADSQIPEAAEIGAEMLTERLASLEAAEKRSEGG